MNNQLRPRPIPTSLLLFSHLTMVNKPTCFIRSTRQCVRTCYIIFDSLDVVTRYSQPTRRRAAATAASVASATNIEYRPPTELMDGQKQETFRAIIQ